MPGEGTSTYNVLKDSALGSYFATTTTLQAVYAAEIAVLFSILTGKLTIPTAVTLSSYIPAVVLAAPVVGATVPLLYHSAKLVSLYGSKDTPSSAIVEEFVEMKISPEKQLTNSDVSSDDEDIWVVPAHRH